MDSPRTRAINDLFPRPQNENTTHKPGEEEEAEESRPLLNIAPPIAVSEADDIDGITKPHASFKEEDDDSDPDFKSRAGGGIGGFVDLSGTYLGPEAVPDVNIYQHKKTVAQGLMDLALFSANANQLRYVMDSKDHPYFWPGVILITFSLIFQVAVGVGLLLNTRYDVKDKREICIANKINNFTIIGIFLITVVNVFISTFGVATNNNAAVS